jgi:hypothetical protein
LEGLRFIRAWVLLMLVVVPIVVQRVALADGAGALVIVTDPPGIEIVIDGENAGVSPVKKSLLPGDHLVEAKFPRGKASQVVKVSAGQSAVVNIAPSATPAVTATVPTATATTPSSTASAPPPPSETATSAAPQTSATAPAGEVAPITAGAHVIEGDVLSRAHPHRRIDVGAAAALGIRCPVLITKGDADNAGCGFLVHLVPVDWFFGELMFDIVAGGAGPFGMAPGFAIGSPWFRVGGDGSPVVMNVRLRAAYSWQQITKSGATGLFESLELGPHVGASWAVSRLVSLDASLVTAVDLVGDNHLVGSNSGLGVVVQAAVGAHL